MEDSWRWRDWAQGTGNSALLLHFGPGRALHWYLILTADICSTNTPLCQHYTWGWWDCWSIWGPKHCPHPPWGTSQCATCNVALFRGSSSLRHGDESPEVMTPLSSPERVQRGILKLAKKRKYMLSLTTISELSYSHVNKAPIFLPSKATMILIIDWKGKRIFVK